MNEEAILLLNAPPIFLDMNTEDRRTYTVKEVIYIVSEKHLATYNLDGTRQCKSGCLRSIRDFLIILKTNCNFTDDEAVKATANLIHQANFAFLWCSDIKKPTLRRLYNGFWEIYANRFNSMHGMNGYRDLSSDILISEVMKYLPEP